MRCKLCRERTKAMSVKKAQSPAAPESVRDLFCDPSELLQRAIAAHKFQAFHADRLGRHGRTTSDKYRKVASRCKRAEQMVKALRAKLDDARKRKHDGHGAVQSTSHSHQPAFPSRVPFHSPPSTAQRAFAVTSVADSPSLRSAGVRSLRDADARGAHLRQHGQTSSLHQHQSTSVSRGFHVPPARTLPPPSPAASHVSLGSSRNDSFAPSSRGLTSVAASSPLVTALQRRAQAGAPFA